MFDRKVLLGSCLALAAGLLGSTAANAAPACPVTYTQLKTALVSAQQANTTGFMNNFWGVVVNRGGVICAVAYSGSNTGSQWLASRQIAAAKAFTANGLSLNYHGTGQPGTTALSTANLYQFVQPSNPSVANPLFGLDGGNVQDATLIYMGDYTQYGTANDPIIGIRLGGTITFGGGLALYSGNFVVGGLGLSGDTACADHSTAWQTRQNLGMQVPGNPAPDMLVFASNNNMTNGHPHCPNDTGTKGSSDPGAELAKR